ncbi:MAG: hypothetical protein IE933_03600 [Sphingomonadales bacterium]|nr:hypothetical protein [Sphingomonadales bacterium]MBD3772129.1 hypothetical protein [Paracoccaceae bacterium]
MSVLPSHDIALVVDGMAYLGWTSVEVGRAIDSASGTFALELASKERTDAQEWDIADGVACEIRLGGAVLLTGYVDSVDRFIDPEARGIRLRGRDKAADLVDCSAVHKPGSWSGRRLEDIARDLLAPFSIPLEVAGDTSPPFRKFALQQGETVFAAIERMARYRGLVAWSPGDGRLVIGNPDSGLRSGRISEGENVIAAEASRDMSERFSDYLVKGQASGDDRRSGKAVAQAKGSATDPEVTRYRPLLVIGEEQADVASLSRRAAWEAAVRSGRSKPVSVTLPGWFDDAGKPWQPGTRAACRLQSLRVDADLLVQRVTMSRDAERGTLTELELVPPEAWSQLREKEPAQ